MGGPPWLKMTKHRHGMGMGPIGMMGMMGGCPQCGGPMPGIMEGPHAGKGPLKRSDDQIKTNVEELLTKDSWLDASDVQVSVSDGVVSLAGSVDSRESKRRAEDLTDRVMGVIDVNNAIGIAEPEE